MAQPGNHWRNRIVEQRDADIDSLVANPRNWRIHPAHQHQDLDAALDRLGWLRPIVVNVHSGVIVDGHLRVLRARARGETSVPAYFVDLSEREEAVLLYAFDLSAGLADRDRARMESLSRRLPQDDATLGYLFQSFRRGEAALLEEAAGLFRGLADAGKAGLVRFRVGPYTWDEEEVVYEAWLAQLRAEAGDDGHLITQAILGRLQYEHA